MKNKQLHAVIVSITLFLVLISLAAVPVHAAPVVVTVEVNGPITTSTAELIQEAINDARTANAAALVLLMNTPGGLVSATFDIIDSMERSPVPVVTFVYPQGARAWSAGTFILLGSHVAAMAPFTIAGSSQPVSYSPLGGGGPINDTKTINALTAYISERARIHSRNQTAARLFIEKNLNVNEELALRYHVIEAVARDIPELLQKIDGIRVDTAAGKVTLQTIGVSVVAHGPSLRLRLLNIISDPILAGVALLIGIYAVIFGFSSPGHFAEILGAFLLIVGLIGIGLNVSVGSLLLLAVGAILMIAEGYVHTHGLLGGAGLVFIVIGSLLLVPFEASRWIISIEFFNLFTATMLAASSVLGGFTAVLVYKIIKARLRKPIIRHIVGDAVDVVDDIEPGKIGFVKYHGEYWQATSEITVRKGMRAKVIAKEGPVLRIAPEA